MRKFRRMVKILKNNMISCDLLENFESMRAKQMPISIGLCLIQLAEQLVREKLDYIGVSKLFELFESSILMSKQTPLPVRAEQLLLERSASFRFILSIDGSCLSNQVLVAMSKLALVAIATHTNLNPVLAHLCFVLSLVCLGRGSLRTLLV